MIYHKYSKSKDIIIGIDMKIKPKIAINIDYYITINPFIHSR